MLLIAVLVIFGLVAILIACSAMLRMFFAQNMAEFLRDVRMIWSKKRLDERIRLWKDYVDVYAKIDATKKSSAPPAPGTAATDPPFGVVRINYLSSDRLRILEGKFSTVLQVQALLGVMVGILINRFWDQLLQKALDWRTAPWLALAFVLWLLTIVGCLSAIGNVRWGNLGVQDTLKEAEQVYVDTLVPIVVVRTAMLRLLSLLALANLLLVSVLISFWALESLSQTQKGGNPSRPPITASIVPPASEHQFKPGQVCTDDLDNWIQQIAASVSKDSSHNGLVVGSADALPLKPSLRKLRGNNIGLAFARANCVAERITRELSRRQIQVHLDVQVRDVLDRGNTSARDRVVTVSWLP